jgi:hypothetical protein
MAATKDDFLTSFTGNKARARLLRVFLFNQADSMTVGEAAKRAGISTKAARSEINSLTKLGIVKKAKGSARKGTKKADVLWGANPECAHLRPLSSFVHEVSPVRYDNIVGALKKTGKISAVILSGAFMGDPSRPADLLVAADTFNERRMEMAVRVLEPLFGREIRYAAFTTPEFRYRLTIQDRLIRDTLDFPHVVLLDRTRLL